MNIVSATAAALLLSFSTLTHGATVSGTKADTSGTAQVDATTEASAGKAATISRYKRIRAKAHRNAARAKAHARAMRASDDDKPSLIAGTKP